KNRGNEWFSPVTSLTQYEPDKDSIMVYSATAGMACDLSKGVSLGEPKPEIDEFNWGGVLRSLRFKFNLAVQARVIKQCLLALIKHSILKNK
ncbi:aryl-sulfate sulfotransferase, partial [Campylobacter jejuni]|nr:aryl-sulfate sulfotransferase [Campylobacter jejuni]